MKHDKYKITFQDDFTFFPDPNVKSAFNALLKQRMLAKLSKAYVNLSDTRRLGKVIKMNDKTVWVSIMDGASTSFIVKRHIDKHNVRFV